MRAIRLLTGLACLAIVGVAGCGESRNGVKSQSEELSPQQSDSMQRANDLSFRAGEMADSMVALMTLEEKASQLMMPALYSSDDVYTLKAVGEYGKRGIGGIVLLKGNSASVVAIADSLRNSSSVPPFVSIDAEWGLGMRLKDEPSYPFNSDIKEDATENDMFRYGATVGKQCRVIGINMVLGPVVDVAPRGSFMSRRSYGSDPVRVSDLAVAYSRGLESIGVMSVAKHFPGHGSAIGDSHKSKPVIERSLHQMDSIDLYPFRKYIEAGLSGVMVGHLAVPAIDPDMQPAAVSHTVISELLIKELGFNGLVLTDALSMGGAEGAGADKAIEAGADIILAPADTGKAIESILKAVSDGRITEERLDRSVRKILFYKFLMELRKGLHYLVI
ncbi:MAG: hypothetical protein K2J87_01480 [Muribaculaceae bacterium]|nr:hypothetical protein [Muribaculaceae bacterium]